MNIKTVCGQSCVEHSLPSSAVFAAGNNHIHFTPIEATEPTCGNTQRQMTMNITNTFTWTWEKAIKVGGDIKFLRAFQASEQSQKLSSNLRPRVDKTQ